MRRLLLPLLVLFSFALIAEEEKLPPLDPDYMGVHGMVLFNQESTLYASHMPTYRKPHDAQVVYQITTTPRIVTYLVRDADLVTIKPKQFNLQRLIRGEQFTVVADVYSGHFERQGSLVYPDVEINFDEQLYVRMLNDIAPAGLRQNYDSIDLGSKGRILIHQIKSAPSYDHLVLAYEKISCVTEFFTSREVPAQNELLRLLSPCGSLKPLYFEERDFR